MRGSAKWMLSIAAACVAALFCAPCSARQTAGNREAVRANAAPYADKLGVELDGIGDGSREKPFVDLAKTLRPWSKIGGQADAAVDAAGWPATDAQTVLFDIRPAYAWAPPMDDPDAFKPDWSGVYAFSFHGQADVKLIENTQPKLQSVRYDDKTNTTTGQIVVPKGCGLLILAFINTKRKPGDAAGTGITDLRVIRPGYPADTKQVFTTEFIRSLKPFKVLRYMDWLDTNHNPGYYGDAGHHALNWADRRLSTDGTQQSTGGKYGVGWEYAIELANQTRTDVWINIPVAATDDYVTQLATLLKRTLSPDRKIYIEHSNEVWNFGFPQYIYNKLAAIDEVNKGGSTLNNDGSMDQEVWTHRRHAKRLVEIAGIFRKVFGDSAMLTRIRPIYASWVISPDAHYRDVLAWVEKTYGAPNKYFYGLAGGAYYNVEKAPANATVDQLIDAMRASSDGATANRKAIQKIADSYGLKHCQYEIGPDTGGGSTVNVANRIRANRSPRMKELLLHDAVDNWFSQGGDLYMYFSHCSAYSRHGCWGLSEDIADVNTPKWKAIYELTGQGSAR